MKPELVACDGHPTNRFCKVLNGTHYHMQTPDDLIIKLEELRVSQERLRFVHEGNYIETGRIGRSMGTCRIPLVMYNRRSMGGGGLMDHCLVRIETSKGKRVLWEIFP